MYRPAKRQPHQMYLRTISQSVSHSVSLLVCRQLNCEEIETRHHTLSSEKRGSVDETQGSYTDRMEPQFCTAKHGLVATTVTVEHWSKQDNVLSKINSICCYVQYVVQ